MKIAYGNSRMEKKWKNNDISWEDFCKRVSTTQTTMETVEEFAICEGGYKEGTVRGLCESP